ncbi:transketolase-like TK C-terminal-containing protein [Escherichia coli]
MCEDSGGKPDIILIATGSEMEITLQAAEKLAGEGRNVRVVSLPSTDIFDAQDEEYRESVLPSNVAASLACGGSRYCRLLVQVCWSERGNCRDDGLRGICSGG